MTTAELDDLAFRFFKLFAQYEWALKAMGHVFAHRQTGAAMGDWNSFCNASGAQVLTLQQADARAAIEYLFTTPPKLQVYVDGKLDWRPVSGGPHTAQALFGHIRRIRNNLYHGGKFNGVWLEPERNGELIRHALAILASLLEEDDQLRQAISSNVG